MKRILNKIRNLIKQAVVNSVTDDSSAYPTVGVYYHGKESKAVRMSPYGLCSNPPNGSNVLLLSENGQESLKYALVDDLYNRFKDLEEGEVVLTNYVTGTYIRLKSNDDIEIYTSGNISAAAGGNAEVTTGGTLTATATGDTTITSPNITLVGNVTIAGSLSQTGASACNFTGTVTIAEVIINSVTMSDHQHQEYDSGGLTGVPQ